MGRFTGNGRSYGPTDEQYAAEYGEQGNSECPGHVCTPTRAQILTMNKSTMNKVTARRSKRFGHLLGRQDAIASESPQHQQRIEMKPQKQIGLQSLEGYDEWQPLREKEATRIARQIGATGKASNIQHHEKKGLLGGRTQIADLFFKSPHNVTQTFDNEQYSMEALDDFTIRFTRR